MAKLSIFVFISLDGYYKDAGGDINWHRHGGEEAEFSEDSVGQGNVLLFGRKTYDMMAAFWPAEMALNNLPVIAAGMNSAAKIVFSSTMKTAEWNNTRIIGGNIVDEVKKLKETSAKDMTILGSGSILTQLTDAGLIDEYQFMIDPVALGAGETVFKNIKQKFDLELISSKVFKSGTILVNYIPLA